VERSSNRNAILFRLHRLRGEFVKILNIYNI